VVFVVFCIFDTIFGIKNINLFFFIICVSDI
jgi:hypothetical protein